MSRYHEKFYSRKGPFTGRIFTNEEFLEHLTNINFHAEYAVLSKLPADKLKKIKNKFVFEGYFAGIKDFKDEYSFDEFLEFVKKETEDA